MADGAGVPGLEDDIDHLRGVGGVDEDLEAHLGDERDGVLRPAVDLGVAALATEPLDLADGHALDAEALQCSLDILELERLEHRGYELHEITFAAAGTEDEPISVPDPPEREVPNPAHSYAD